MSRDLFAGNSDQMMTEFDNIQSEDVTDSTILYEPQRLRLETKVRSKESIRLIINLIFIVLVLD
jgi:hypothetical protein